MSNQLIESAAHCVFNESTQTFLARPGSGCDEEMQQFLKDAGEIFATATRTVFESSPMQSVSSRGLRMQRVSGWHEYTRRVVKGYTAGHFDLVSTDADYRDGLYGIMQRYSAMHGLCPDRPARTARGEVKRRTQECHKMVKDAAFEGISTLLAMYQVVPGVVSLQMAHIAKQEQAAISNAALPSTAKLAKRLAYHSKRGDKAFLGSMLRGGAAKNPVNYAKLELDPTHFAIEFSGDGPELQIAGFHANPTDPNTYFTGCPAIFGGSVELINRYIRGSLTQEQCYERAFLGELAVVSSALAPASAERYH